MIMRSGRSTMTTTNFKIRRLAWFHGNKKLGYKSLEFVYWARKAQKITQYPSILDKKSQTKCSKGRFQKKVWNFPYFSGVGGFEKVISIKMP